MLPVLRTRVQGSREVRTGCIKGLRARTGGLGLWSRPRFHRCPSTEAAGSFIQIQAGAWPALGTGCREWTQQCPELRTELCLSLLIRGDWRCLFPLLLPELGEATDVKRQEARVAPGGLFFFSSEWA